MQSKSLFEKAIEELGYNASGLLRSTSEASDTPNFEDLSAVSEWLYLEKGKRLEAHYVYFRRFDGRPSQPLVYVYNFEEGMLADPELGKIHRNIWSSGEVPCAMIFSKDAVRVLNTTCQPAQNGEEFLPVDLIDLAHEITTELRERLSAYRLDSGEFWHEEAKELAYDKSAHKTLLKKLGKVKNKFLDAEIDFDGKLVNRLLIQCVLIRFLEEKKEKDENGIWRYVFPSDFFQKIAQTNNFKESLEKGTFTKVFKYLNSKDSLNGQIFLWTETEEKQLLSIPTPNLVDWLYETAKDENSQLAFWDLYSFRFLPVEVISSIYEALFTTDKSVKEDGMVYTPPHLAAFLVDEAMPLNAWKGREDFKVLDPACGSGVFLVFAFKRLVHWWRLRHQGKSPEVDDLMEILSKSITGVDKEENAVLLTRFSLCLAVCDMLAPPEVFNKLHFPELKNELIRDNFFDWFIGTAKGKLEYDLVIGNPPFVQAHKELPAWKEVSDVTIPQKQIVLYFLSAGMQLVKEKGLLCLLLKSSSLLYTSTGNNFRKHFFDKNNVRQIIDFTLLARNHVLWEVGEPDTLALFIAKEKPNTLKNILHLVVKRTPSNSLKRYFEIDAYDFHWVPYVAALQDDYVWKCNLLGGGRLYGLINRLKAAYTTLLGFVDSQEGWACSVGYRTSNNPEDYECPEITDKPTLPTEWLTEDGLKSEDFPDEKSKYFYRKSDFKIYKAPHLLIKLNVGDKHSIPILYYPEFSVGFKEKIFGIHSPDIDKPSLTEVYKKVKRYNNIYRTFLFATSPESLVHMNTVVQASDIKSLPFPKRINEEIILTKTEDITINDVLKYHQESIRQTNATTLHPITSKILSNHLSKFSKTFCESLNTIYEKSDLKFRLADAGSLHNNKFLYVAFHYDDQPDFSFSGKSEDAPEVSEDKLKELLTLDKGYARFSRIMKIYKKDYVCFIKPNQLRYWLDSIALRDADWVLDDLVKDGH